MWNSFVALAALAASASAFDCHGPYFSFYNRNGEPLSTQRLDPALYPGVQSPHLHSFDGGNALASTMDFGTTQSSTCTTARIKPDKSLYWRPTLFWNGNNTGFYRVPSHYLKLYYKFGDGNDRANVTEFPEDFSMIAGNPFLRHEDTTSPLQKGAGIKWSCKGENYKATDAKGFPKGFTSCKDGLTSEITFPACWNGQPLDPKNPSAHMAYPTNGGKGIMACPEGFRQARFPTIFIEFWYDVSAFDGHYSADSVPWVLSNGDPTGYGFHADFKNGWEKGVLAKATGETGYCNCGCGCGTDQMKQCFGAENVNDDNPDFKSCAAKPEFPGEDKSPLEKLPGCNPLQAGPADATKVTGDGCGAAPAPATSAKAGASATSQPAKGSATTSKEVDATSAKPTTGAGNTDASKPTQAATTTISKHHSKGGSRTTKKSRKGTPTTTPSATFDAQNQYATDGPSNDDDDLTETKKTPADSTVAATKPADKHTDAPKPTSTPSSDGHNGNNGNHGNDGKCPAPVYVTITPTVTVTAGAANVAGLTGTCGPATVSVTLTDTKTVTVTPVPEASGGYMHKRHPHVRRH